MGNARVTYGERHVAMSDLGRQVIARDIAKVSLALRKRKSAKVTIGGRRYVIRAISPPVID